MSAPQKNVYSIEPGCNFLDVLAGAVLEGFPITGRGRPDPLKDLPRWTILLPTRRAVRELERIFLQRLGGRGALLPRIRPLGDIDEDLLSGPDVSGQHLSPEAISPIGRELVLMALIESWAAENPQASLAGEIAGSPHQSHALARSLAEFIDNLETEEIDASQISQLFDLEQARHREAILDFLALVRLRLPAELRRWGLCGSRERQSRLLREEAARLRNSKHAGPIVAAGSTGTIAATRELLAAIAGLDTGAVVLPGLDLAMTEEDWAAIGPQHAQYAMKQLMASLGVERGSVECLGEPLRPERSWLIREFMRPAEGSEGWQRTIAAGRSRLNEAADGMTMIEAASREEEALAIAVLLREALEVPERTAALITPDRDLARRVKQELKRWNIEIDDSAGEPLVMSPGPALAAQLLETVIGGSPPSRVVNLLKHHLCTLGLAPADLRRARDVLDIVVLKSILGLPPSKDLTGAVTSAHDAAKADGHLHPIVARVSEEDWAAAAAVAGKVSAIVDALRDDSEMPLDQHVEAVVTALEAIAGSAIWSDEPGALLHALLAGIAVESPKLGLCRRRSALSFIAHHLRATPFRPSRGQTPRLSIFGLLEARLMRADLHVLGGLSEGVWPAFPDSGPWINRPMRSILNMQQPERAIGQMAHDFAQALGAPEVTLVWPRRIGADPANPSRWVLRLNMLLGRNNNDSEAHSDPPRWLQWARGLDRSSTATPVAKPRPKPPLSARPRSLSVTQIETLIRDPYAIYAQKILALDPVDLAGQGPDYSLRGSLIHQALAQFSAECARQRPTDPAARLRAIGAEVFAPHMKNPVISAFWWPRFGAIADWWASEEQAAWPLIQETFVEITGKLTIPVGAGAFLLTARADRIDVLRDGSCRIIDYKTGSVPSGPQVKQGLAPQLTLEAAMAARGAFAEVGARPVSQASYIRLSGGSEPGKIQDVAGRDDIKDLADEHLGGLAKLIEGYDDQTRPYLPRSGAVKVDAELSHDHLSRYREWILSDGRS